MRDLEIRGAGNLLGADQSGHIAAVGYDLYVPDGERGGGRAEGRGGPRAGRDQARAAARRLPADRLREPRGPAHRGLPAPGCRSPPTGEVDDIAAEWTDRFGPPPPPAEALLRVARLRAECSRIGVREVAVAKDIARISPIRLKTSQTVRLAAPLPQGRVQGGPGPAHPPARVLRGPSAAVSILLISSSRCSRNWCRRSWRRRAERRPGRCEANGSGWKPWLRFATP